MYTVNAPYIKSCLLFAHCPAFQALLGCFYVEKISVAAANLFLIHSLCLLFQSHFPTPCRNAQRMWFPYTKTGVCLWNKLLFLSRQCSQLFPWIFQVAAPQLPISHIFQTGHLNQWCLVSGLRLHQCPLPLWERKLNCFFIS